MATIIKKPAYQIKSNLSEDQIAKDVSNYLGWLSTPGISHFRLLSVDENIFGADAKFNCAIPMYLQFKVSNGLQSVNKITPSSRRNRSRLEDIRIFRNSQDLFDDPSLYFELRAKSNHAEDFQHNILLKLANTGFSKAFYVAPLTLSEKKYTETLFKSTKKREVFYPFFEKDNIAIHQKNWVSYLGTIPFLRGHISIVPHEIVDTNKHSYAFGKNGSDISWHSPQFLPSSPSRLSDRLQEIYRLAFSNKNAWQDLRALNEKLSQLELNLDQPIREFQSNLTQLEILQSFGVELYKKYQIYQILILSTFEKITEL